MMSDVTIHYRFTLDDGSEEAFELALDERTLELRATDSAELPPKT